MRTCRTWLFGLRELLTVPEFPIYCRRHRDVRVRKVRPRVSDELFRDAGRCLVFGPSFKAVGITMDDLCSRRIGDRRCSGRKGISVVRCLFVRGITGSGNSDMAIRSSRIAHCPRIPRNQSRIGRRGWLVTKHRRPRNPSARRRQPAGYAGQKNSSHSWNPSISGPCDHRSEEGSPLLTSVEQKSTRAWLPTAGEC
jgi:hypothetical protein